MKTKIQKIAMPALVIAAFVVALMINLGTKSTIASAMAQSTGSGTGTGTGTGSGTGTGQIGRYKPILVAFYKTLPDGQLVLDHYGWCCGEGTDVDCITQDC